MSQKIKITLTSSDSLADLRKEVDFSAKKKPLELLKDVLGGPVSGADVQCLNQDDVAASGTITFSGTGAANDTILINGVTFTAKASGATGNQWNVGASAAASATALKNAINTSVSSLISGVVTASDNGAGVVTITAVTKGKVGNCITLAEGVDANSHMAESGARLTGGVDESSSAVSYSF